MIVNFGYRQSQIYNIDCQVAPLIDLIQRQSHADINRLLSAKEALFNKEVTDLAKKAETIKHKIYLIENPPPPEEEKNEYGLRRRRKEETPPPPIEKPPTPPPPKEEEKKKAKNETAAKGKKDNKKQEEVKELTPEEIKQQKLEAEKESYKKEIEDVKSQIDKYNDKIVLIRKSKEKFQDLPKEIDLIDSTGSRKFLKTRSEDQANLVLNQRTTYTLAIIREETVENYTLDGYCVRTIEEDSTYIEEPTDPKAKAKTKRK